MRKTRYRLILHDNVDINPNYMERIDNSTIVSYISEMEYNRQKSQGITGLFFTCPYTGAVGPIDSLWFKEGFVKSQSDILDRLERAVDVFIYNTFRQPTLILLHPLTYQKLRESAIFDKSYSFTPDMKTFRGIKIKTSLDVEENTIETY